MKIKFLSVKQILQTHIRQIELIGGAHGIRDMGLLISSTQEPKSTFNKNYLYNFPFEMAACYAYSIINNHPFIDGNKRTGMISAIVFLRLNSVYINLNNDDFFSLAMLIANNKLNYQQLAKEFSSLLIAT